MVAALGLLGVWRLAMRLIGAPSVAFWTALLTGLYPIWFAQSTLAHADIYAAAGSIWGMVYALPNRGRNAWAAALWFSAAALCKETAIAIPLTLAAVNLGEGIWRGGPSRGRLWREAAWLAGCVVPLAGWYGYHYAKTGFVFGNAAYVHYNAQATLAPLRILAAFAHRVLHLTAHMNLFVPVLMASAAMLLSPRPDREGHERATLGGLVLLRIFFMVLVNAVLFSVLGGALLTRYLLPMYPLVLLACVSTIYRRVPYWAGLAAVSAAAFAVGLFINPPYGFAPEDNLAYAHVIRMHQSAIGELKKRYPAATVLTAWPVSDELRRPELGYVKQPWDVVAIDDFSPPQIDRAAQETAAYSAALVFSTKYDPPKPLFSFDRGAIEERYFGLHHDLAPERIASRLDGSLEWRRDEMGLWIALIRFHHPVEAQSAPEGPRPAGD